MVKDGKMDLVKQKEKTAQSLATLSGILVGVRRLELLAS